MQAPKWHDSCNLDTELNLQGQSAPANACCAAYDMQPAGCLQMLAPSSTAACMMLHISSARKMHLHSIHQGDAKSTLHEMYHGNLGSRPSLLYALHIKVTDFFDEGCSSWNLPAISSKKAFVGLY